MSGHTILIWLSKQSLSALSLMHSEQSHNNLCFPHTNQSKPRAKIVYTVIHFWSSDNENSFQMKTSVTGVKLMRLLYFPFSSTSRLKSGNVTACYFLHDCLNMYFSWLLLAHSKYRLVITTPGVLIFNHWSFYLDPFNFSALVPYKIQNRI